MPGITLPGVAQSGGAGKHFAIVSSPAGLHSGGVPLINGVTNFSGTFALNGSGIADGDIFFKPWLCPQDLTFDAFSYSMSVISDWTGVHGLEFGIWAFDTMTGWHTGEEPLGVSGLISAVGGSTGLRTWAPTAAPVTLEAGTIYMLGWQAQVGAAGTAVGTIGGNSISSGYAVHVTDMTNASLMGNGSGYYRWLAATNLKANLTGVILPTRAVTGAPATTASSWPVPYIRPS